MVMENRGWSPAKSSPSFSAAAIKSCPGPQLQEVPWPCPHCCSVCFLFWRTEELFHQKWKSFFRDFYLKILNRRYHRRYTLVLWYMILLHFSPQDFLLPFVSRSCSLTCLQLWEILLLPTHIGAGALLFIMHYTQVGDFKRTPFFCGALKLETQNAHQKKRISQFLFFQLSYLLCHPFRVGGDVYLHGW